MILMRTLLFIVVVGSLCFPAYSDTFKRVNMNTADVKTLTTLPGIGQKRAESIVHYRSKRPFTRVSQLLNIRGIGRKTLRRLRPLIVVQSPQKKKIVKNERGSGHLLDKGPPNENIP